MDRATKVTWLGFFWNIALAVIKIVAGYLGKSQALIADGFHSFSDLIGDVAVLTGLKISRRPRDKTHNYGHGKFETLSALIISLLLIFVSIGILWAAVTNIFKAMHGAELHEPKWFSIIIILFAIGIKEWLFHYTNRVGKQENSQALIMNALHHRTDSLSSVAVLIGLSGAVILGGNWRILDPITALLVGILILFLSFKTVIRSTNEMMEAALSIERQQNILSIAAEVPGVINPHNLKTRRIGKDVAIDMHIKVTPSLSIVEAHDIATEVENRLKDYFEEDCFISIHVEPFEGH
jgi:cation diffusion facilitator family transporter